MNTDIKNIFGVIKTLVVTPTHVPKKLGEQVKIVIDPTSYDTGALSPSTNGTPATYDGSATEYTSPENAYADDAAYATVTDNEANYKYQSYGGFGISIPAGATILGIELKAKGKASAVVVPNDILIYNKTANDWYSNSGNFFTTTEAEQSYGGASDLMGFSWQASDFSDANFAIIHRTGGSNNARVTSLNHLTVKVYYSVKKLSIYDPVSNSWKGASLI